MAATPVARLTHRGRPDAAAAAAEELAGRSFLTTLVDGSGGKALLAKCAQQVHAEADVLPEDETRTMRAIFALVLHHTGNTGVAMALADVAEDDAEPLPAEVALAFAIASELVHRESEMADEIGLTRTTSVRTWARMAERARSLLEFSACVGDTDEGAGELAPSTSLTRTASLTRTKSVRSRWKTARPTKPRPGLRGAHS